MRSYREWIITDMEFVDWVMNGQYREVETALKSDPSLAGTSADGVSAILLALFQRHDQVAHLIRSYRSRVDLCEVAALGEIETIHGLQEVNQLNMHADSANGLSPLALACYFGHAQVALMLIDAGADVNEPASGATITYPLHAALGNGFVELARMLVALGADPNLRGADGWSALHYATDLGDAQLVEDLLKAGADPTLRDDQGFTAAELGNAVGHHDAAGILEQHKGGGNLI